jgi:8-oxo-dGTP pyrophosphatase MutT (NUDIX family)
MLPTFQLPRPPGFRDAAVLVATWQDSLLLTVRSASLAHHAAQISFPGGRLDHGETPRQAALREAWEEVGLEPSSIEIVGELNPTLSPFGYRVLPVVGRITHVPRLKPNPQEVASVLWVPLAELVQAPAYSRARDHKLLAGLSPEIREAMLPQN